MAVSLTYPFWMKVRRLVRFIFKLPPKVGEQYLVPTAHNTRMFIRLPKVALMYKGYVVIPDRTEGKNRQYLKLPNRVFHAHAKPHTGDVKWTA